MSSHHISVPVIEALSFRRKMLKAVFVLSGLAFVLAGAGVFQRNLAVAQLAQQALHNNVPSVSVLTVSAATDSQQLVLPGNLEPLNSASIYAQTNGYLKEWRVDIGDEVKKGQVLAELDAPELFHQLAQAKADYATALAAERNAQAMADRANQLMQKNSGALSREVLEQRQRDAEAKVAATAAEKAKVNRLETLQHYTQLKAPFDGRVTQRSAQIGELVVAGNAKAQPLFTIADTRSLRIFVQVPQNSAAQITMGQTAELVVPEQSDKQFSAKVTRSAQAVDTTTGSMLVELQVDNSKGELLPGAYVQVNFKLAQSKDAVRVPGSAILFREKQPMIASVDSNNKVMLKSIKIGRDEGASVEITAGIAVGDRIITTPPDAIDNGDLVNIVNTK